MAAILALLLLMFIFWLGFHLTGAILSMIFWVCIRLPITCILGALGLLCCCTILLIPVGLALFRAAFGVLIPG